MAFSGCHGEFEDGVPYGYYNNDQLKSKGAQACIWTSDLVTSGEGGTVAAFAASINDLEICFKDLDRFYGLQVRPVRDKK